MRPRTKYFIGAVQVYEALQCESCGEIDTIHLGNDCGHCTECYAVEHYTEVIVNEDGEIVEGEPIAATAAPVLPVGE